MVLGQSTAVCVADDDVAMPEENLVSQGYDAVYEALPRAKAFRRLWSEKACGLNYPAEYDHISFVTLDELATVSEWLEIAAGAVLVDLACGAGGPGLWVARHTGATLVGVDFSTVGLARARQRAEQVGMAASTTFVQGSFEATGRGAGTADAAVSFDALQYAPDKAAAFREAARVVRRGGRFVFTAFEVVPERVADLPIFGEHPVADFAPLLERAGFTVFHYEETSGWRERVRATYQAVLDGQEPLSKELGLPAYLALATEMALTLERDIYRRRVLVAAIRAHRAGTAERFRGVPDDG